MKNIIVSISILLLLPFNLVWAQQAYFVDGYHGGIYGHYPMWVTQFIIDNMKQHPEWKIGLEIEPETWDTVQMKTPDTYFHFKRLTNSDRIEFTNPTYAQPYCYNISGESLIRQFEYGIKKMQRHFPHVTFSTYSVEEPCFTGSLPQILKSFGFKYAVLKCPDTCWGGYAQAYGGELVNWIGPDGTSILTVPRYECEKLEDYSTWQTMAWNNSSAYLNACFDYGICNPVGMCYQDAGWKNGPWIGIGDFIENGSKYITWKEYFEQVTTRETSDDWHFSQEDILVNLVWGSQVLQQIAQAVRVSENKIVAAEKIGAIAYLTKDYSIDQHQIDEAWRTLMLAQHHDSWIVPYNQLNENRTWAEEIALWTNNTNTIADKLINEATENDEVKTESNQLGYVRVYNTTGTERIEITEINLPEHFHDRNIILYSTTGERHPSHIEKKDGSVFLIFSSKTPPFGFSTYSIQEGAQDYHWVSGVHRNAQGDYVLENDMYRIILDVSKGGTIKSLVSKKEGNKDFVNPNSRFCLGELRGHFYEDRTFYSSADCEAIVKIVEDNCFRTRVRVEGSIASHSYTQFITLTSGQKRIDFDLTMNWKHNVGIGEFKQRTDWRENRRAFADDRYKLSVMFPVDFTSSRLYKNAPFDVCESRLENTFFNTWDSIKHNVILHWVDLVQKDNQYGLALFSDHTTSYSYGEDFPLSITAQYSGNGLWGVDYKITEALKMRYALVPHVGKWDQAHIQQESTCWNEPLVARYYNDIALEDKAYLKIDSPGYELTAAKKDGEGILVRFFNAEGDSSLRKISFNFPIVGIDEVDMKGDIIAKPSIEAASGNSLITVAMPRFGIKTFRIKVQS